MLCVSVLPRLLCAFVGSNGLTAVGSHVRLLVVEEIALMPKRRTLKRQLKAETTDDEWIRRHFEELVDQYAGQYVVVASGEVFVGQDARRLFAKARRKHPGMVPTGMPVPRPQDFLCAL